MPRGVWPGVCVWYGAGGVEWTSARVVGGGMGLSPLQKAGVYWLMGAEFGWLSKLGNAGLGEVAVCSRFVSRG